MLSVQAPPVQMDRHEISVESNSIQEIESMPQVPQVKQQQKKRILTPTKVLIGVAIFVILSMASYQLYITAFPSNNNSKLDQSHVKFIQTAGSSSGKDTSSNSGSQSSKNSRDSSKPIGVAATTGKDVITSNIGKGGSSTGGSGEDEGPSEEDNDGEKRKKHLDKNAKDGSSTEGDSMESAEEDESGQNDGQVGVWPNNGGTGSMPLVGSTRN